MDNESRVALRKAAESGELVTLDLVQVPLAQVASIDDESVVLVFSTQGGDPVEAILPHQLIERAR